MFAEYDFVVREKDIGIKVEGKKGTSRTRGEDKFFRGITTAHQTSGFVAWVKCLLHEETR